jgi:hypothetical protein
MEKCETCGHPILTQVWVNGKVAVKEGRTVVEEAIPGHWETLPYPQTSVLGELHDCAKARERWKPIAALLGVGDLAVAKVTLKDGSVHTTVITLAAGVALADLEGQELVITAEGNTVKLYRQEVSAHA